MLCAGDPGLFETFISRVDFKTPYADYKIGLHFKLPFTFDILQFSNYFRTNHPYHPLIQAFSGRTADNLTVPVH